MKRVITNLDEELVERLDHAQKYFGLPSRNSLIDQILREALWMPTTLTDLRVAMGNWFSKWQLDLARAEEEAKKDA